MESHIKAWNAQNKGYFDFEIVPMKATMKDPKTGEKTTQILFQDDGIRISPMEKLAKLKPSFKKNGTVTPGSAS